MNFRWKTVLKKDPVDWLLSSNPWTKYKTLTDLSGESEKSKIVLETKNELKNHPLVIELIDETTQWFVVPPKRHDDSKISHYKLKILADFGFNISNKNIKHITDKVKKHKEKDLFAIKQALPKKGKFNTKVDEDFDEWHALPCDSTLISSVLYRLGDRSDELMKSIEIIKNKWDNKSGWFCHLFFVESQFKKYQIGCLMAGLQALELFSLLPDLDEKKLVKNAYEPLKFHREYGKSLYYFGRSRKFWSFKYPFVWYNALYLAEVLSRFEFLREEKLVKEIIKWIIDSQDDNGRFRPTSMFRHYSKWDFANKKQASPWITYLCCKILKRYFN